MTVKHLCTGRNAATSPSAAPNINPDGTSARLGAASRRPGNMTVMAAAFALTTLSLGSLGVNSAKAADDNLDQVVTENEVVAPAGETTVVSDGHVDLGPLMIDGTIDFLGRDDRAETPVWRHLDDVVFQLGQAAEQVLPEGGEYDFTGAEAGQTVWAVPQTQVAAVPWLGWSTQSPPVTQIVDRGVNLEFDGHQGDGQFTLFLQSGNFGAPQELWNSTKTEPQSAWVDLKTHTHANWVFTKPGVHLVKVTLKAKLLDGSEVAVPKVLRFAVGDTDPALAAKATWQGQSAPSVEAETASNTDSAVATSSNLMLVTVALIGTGALAALLAAIMMMRSRQAERRAQQQVASHQKGQTRDRESGDELDGE